jgi:hypothetical protein
MTDDKIVDIAGRLPLEVRKPWRHKLPECYAKRIDQLKEYYEGVRKMRSVLETIRTKCSDELTLKSVNEELFVAIILLKHAEEKLLHSLPTEEIMSPKDLKEFKYLLE